MDSSLQDNPSTPDAPPIIDSQQVFELIDRTLPFEACLYHQVLPLSVNGDILTLGMVNLDDVAALEYVQRMLGYMNYRLAPQTLLAAHHHRILSAFLTYQAESRTHQGSATVLPKDVEITESLHQRATLVLNDQDALTEWTVPPDEPITQVSPNIKPTLLLDEDEPDLTAVQWIETALEAALETATETALTEPPSPETSLPPCLPDFPGSALPALELIAPLSDRPLSDLMEIPAPELVQELLNRALSSGVGRLHFESYATESNQSLGRILWSENGVIQSIMPEVSADLLQDLISELKMLLHLPLNQVTAPLQAEIERQYQKQRILLRLRVIPAETEESATIQVLRGAALKFYQQQQIKTLSRDTLDIAHQLNRKIQELGDRLRQQPSEPISPELTQLIKSMDQQLASIKQAMPRD
jgi:type II secretory ATPase GspE/PulE/Tfp pilus assembly ATPase PilB-like protein